MQHMKQSGRKYRNLSGTFIAIAKTLDIRGHLKFSARVIRFGGYWPSPRSAPLCQTGLNTKSQTANMGVGHMNDHMEIKL